MFDAGFTLFEVQHRLGHKSPTLTAKVYTHLMRERIEEGRPTTTLINPHHDPDGGADR